MAKRYGQLPSQVLSLGDSLDIQCANLGVAYENYLNKEAERKHKGDTRVDHNYTTEQLRAMLDSVRKK